MYVGRGRSFVNSDCQLLPLYQSPDATMLVARAGIGNVSSNPTDRFCVCFVCVAPSSAYESLKRQTYPAWQKKRTSPSTEFGGMLNPFSATPSYESRKKSL